MMMMMMMMMMLLICRVTLFSTRSVLSECKSQMHISLPFLHRLQLLKHHFLLRQLSQHRYSKISIVVLIFPGGPGLAGTRLSLFWILLKLRMMEVVVTVRGGNSGSYKTCKAPVKSSPTSCVRHDMPRPSSPPWAPQRLTCHRAEAM